MDFTCNFLNSCPDTDSFLPKTLPEAAGTRIVTDEYPPEVLNTRFGRKNDCKKPLRRCLA
ncbi:MAG: hypothetical protein ACLFSB_13930 [Chitinispirillaceae bacterium]